MTSHENSSSYSPVPRPHAEARSWNVDPIKEDTSKYPAQRSRNRQDSFPVLTERNLANAGAESAAHTIHQSADLLEAEQLQDEQIINEIHSEILSMAQPRPYTEPIDEEFPATQFSAQEASPTPPSGKRSLVAKLLRVVESGADKIKNYSSEKAATVETDGVKALVRRTGHIAAAEATKKQKQSQSIDDNSVSRFINKIGMNSEASRANDGLLLKRLSKNGRREASERREARRVASLEKNFVVDSAEAHDMAITEYDGVLQDRAENEKQRERIEQERQDRILIAEIEAETLAVEASIEAEKKATEVYLKLKEQAAKKAAKKGKALIQTANAYAGSDKAPVKTRLRRSTIDKILDRAEGRSI